MKLYQSNNFHSLFLSTLCHKFSYRFLRLFFLSILLFDISAAAKTIRVGAYDNPPKVFITSNGEITGLFPEVLKLVATEHSWNIEYVQGTWTECLERLEAGEIDLMVDVAVSQERKKRFHFSKEPVLSNWGIIYTNPESKIQTMADLNHTTIAVMKDSIHTDGNKGIKALVKQFDIECKFIEVDTYRDVMTLVDTKEAGAGVVNRMFGSLYASKYDVIPTSIIFNPRLLMFATGKKSKEGQILLNQIDESLHKQHRDFTSPFHKILAYYTAGGRDKQLCKSYHTLAKIKLSSSEKKWIEEHPEIRIGIDKGFAPFELISKDGKYGGIAAGYLNLVEQKTGLKFNLVKYDSWSDNIEAIKQHNIDLLPCIGKSSTREKFLSFSKPYLKFSRVIVTSIHSSIRDLDDLTNLKVGLQKNSSHHVFLTKNSTVQPELYDTFEEAMRAVSNGKIDATIGNLAVVSHVMRDLALTNIKLAGYISDTPQNLYFGARKDWPILTSILNHALNSITLKQSTQIQEKWITLPAEASKDLDLTTEERNWLLAHPRIRVGWDSAWPPIEYADKNGIPRGISIDYLKVISRKLGIHFDMGSVISWQDVHAKFINNELDVLSCVAVTQERMKHFNYTDTYLDIPIVIFGRDDMPYMSNISNLQDFKVAVIQDYATDNWITRDFPNLKLTRAKNTDEAFKLLKKRKVDAFVGNVVVGDYYLSHIRGNRIKIIGKTPYAHKQSMAVRKDWSLLVGILQKAIDSIPESEKTTFYRKWLWLKYEHGFNYYLFSKIVMGGVIFVLLLFYWNRRLATEVKQRSLAESALSKNEQELRKSYSDLKKMESLKNNLTHMVVHDMRTPLTSITGTLELLENYITPEDPDSQAKQILLIGQCSANNLTDMIQSLLDISRFESHEMPIHLESSDLKTICEKAIQSTQIQTKYAKQKVELSGKSVIALMDSTLIHRIFTNLIGNAIKASSAGAIIEIRISDNDTTVFAEVRDYGVGIPEEYLPEIFDKFSSAEKGKERRSTSIGLGLTFCKLAIEAHGGEISVETKIKKGSTFKLELPKTTPST